MFVSIITKYSEYRYDCDSTRVYQQLDETDNEFGFITIEFYKNSRLIYDQPIEKSPDNAVYFMNDNGVTVDKLAWPSKPK